MATTFNPCFDLPQDPFEENRNFCNLQVEKKQLLKMNRVECFRAKENGEKGYRCQNRFFPETLGYFPTLDGSQRATLLFGDGTEIKNLLLPVSPLEKAAELIDRLPLRSSLDIHQKRFEKILLMIDSVPDDGKKDQLLENLALKAKERKLFDKAIDIAKKISDPKLQIVTLGKVLSSPYHPLHFKNNPIDILNAAWDLSEEIESKEDRNFVRLKIIEFQSDAGLFSEAFAFTFLIRNGETRGMARIKIAKRLLEKEPASKVASWLLDLAEADDQQPKVAPDSLSTEIESLRNLPGFVHFTLQTKVGKFHKSNLESVENTYSESTRLPWGTQEALKASLQKVIDRMRKKKIKKSNLQQ